ncbi:polyketide synthase dehydratase-domain-containing protein [Obelidium mucronatum]|nr:polyketide synthase dehydratase-domain-containing protein [Obelidium mucronatum]
MTTVFSAYDDFLRVPKLSPEILPSYIFDRQNVQMPDISGMDLNRSATLSYTPTTFKNLSGSFKPNVQQVRNSENAWIVDHKLRSGAVILPGAALLSIALSALSPHTVASLSFIKPVVLEETADAEFLIARTSTQLDSFQVRQGGIVHCEGIFITETAQVVRTNILEQLPSLLSCGKEIDTKKWYESDQGSIAYGSRFRNVNYLRTYDNGDALACIELPSDITAGGLDDPPNSVGRLLPHDGHNNYRWLSSCLCGKSLGF